MSVLKDFERRLENVVQGAFTKTFRSGLQPVELAKRILREMDSGRTVGVDGSTWAPNHFAFQLSTPDADRFQDAVTPIVAELSRVVVDTARERRWGLVGPPQIVLEANPTLKLGSFRCTSSLAEGGPEDAAIPPADAELNLLEGDRRTQSYALTKPVTTIGRASECDVTLSDGAASRQHAEVRNSGGAYVVADLSSTNGTLVNDQRIVQQPLNDGDRIVIGQTVLEFRRLGI